MTWIMLLLVSTLSQATSASPAPRSFHAAAYDSHRDRLLVYGGNGPMGSYPDATLWEWDGTRWHAHTAPGPGPRDDAALMYDPLQRRVLLFGGRHDDTYYDDLWSWDGAQWRLLAEHGPEARHLTAVAFDAARGEVVVHGGHIVGRNVFPVDTWTYGAQGWRRHTQELAPRFAAGIAYDPATHSVLLHGGMAPDGQLFADTWRWDGARWARIATNGPAGPALYAMDAGSAVVLLHATGEYEGKPLVLWTFENGAWRRVGDGPAWRNGYTMTAGARGELLLFGGARDPRTKYDEIWVFNRTSWDRK